MDVDATGDTFLYPEVEDMGLYVDVLSITIDFTVAGSEYGLCDFVIHGCAGKSQVAFQDFKS